MRQSTRRVRPEMHAYLPVPVVESKFGPLRFCFARFAGNGALAIQAIDAEGMPFESIAVNLVDVADQLQPLQFFVKTDGGACSAAALLLSCKPLVFHATSQSLRYGNFDSRAHVFEVAPEYRAAVVQAIHQYDTAAATRKATSEPTEPDDNAESSRPAL